MIRKFEKNANSLADDWDIIQLLSVRATVDWRNSYGND